MVAARLMTVEEFAELVDDDVRELVDGEIERMSPAGRIHLIVVSRINRAPGGYALSVKGINVMTGGGGFALRRNPDSVLVPDLSITTDVQLKAMTEDVGTFSLVAPLIAIEVKSPSDRESQIARKLAIYLESGIEEVWWVRPERKELTVHRPDSAPAHFATGDTFTSPLLPNFGLRVNELFEDID